MSIFEPAPTRRSIAGQIVYFGSWVVVTFVAALLHANPDGHGTHTQLGLPPCPSALLFDRPCPGCGLTTSWTALVHGDLAAAFHAHPFGPILYLAFTVTAFLALRGWIEGRRLLLDTPALNRATIAFAIMFFCFGLARMAVVPHYRSLHDIAAMR